MSAPTGTFDIQLSQATGATISDDTITLSTGSGGYGVEISAANNATVQNNTVTGGGGNSILIYAYGGYDTTGVAVDNNKVSNSTYFAIYVTGIGGTVEGNTVSATNGAFGIEGSGTSAQSLTIQGNTVFGEINANTSSGAIDVDTDAKRCQYDVR